MNQESKGGAQRSNNTNQRKMPNTPFTMKTRGMIITERIRARLITQLPGDDWITPGDRHDKMKQKLTSKSYYNLYDLGDILAAYTFYDDYLAAIGRGKPTPMPMTMNEIKDWGRRKIKHYAAWAKAGYF